MAVNYANYVYINNECFRGNNDITSVNCSNMPWDGNSAVNGFRSCNYLQTVTGLNNSITNMYGTFSWCKSLNTAPVLPTSVTDLKETFSYCYALTTPPSIPSSVVNMSSTFLFCNHITTPPNIQNGVKSMYATFSVCQNLTAMPEIPNSVTNLAGTFGSCLRITTFHDINAPNCVNVANCFSGCSNLQNMNLNIPNCTNAYGCFLGCYNLRGDINITSNQITNAVNCFTAANYQKNVYIPFRYANRELSATYNAFIAAGFDEQGTTANVYLKDGDPTIYQVDDTEYTIRNISNVVYLDKYIGSATNIIVPRSKS